MAVILRINSRVMPALINALAYWSLLVFDMLSLTRLNVVDPLWPKRYIKNLILESPPKIFFGAFYQENESNLLIASELSYNKKFFRKCDKNHISVQHFGRKN